MGQMWTQYTMDREYDIDRETVWSDNKDVTVRLTYDYTDSSTLKIMWTNGGKVHRIGGPAVVTSFAHLEDFEKLSDLEDPRLLDAWVKRSGGQAAWWVAGCMIHSTSRIGSVWFPEVTIETIHRGIQKEPALWRQWLDAADALGLMDDELRLLRSRLEVF